MKQMMIKKTVPILLLFMLCLTANANENPLCQSKGDNSEIYLTKAIATELENIDVIASTLFKVESEGGCLLLSPKARVTITSDNELVVTDTPMRVELAEQMLEELRAVWSDEIGLVFRIYEAPKSWAHDVALRVGLFEQQGSSIGDRLMVGVEKKVFLSSSYEDQKQLQKEIMELEIQNLGRSINSFHLFVKINEEIKIEQEIEVVSYLDPRSGAGSPSFRLRILSIKVMPSWAVEGANQLNIALKVEIKAPQEIEEEGASGQFLSVKKMFPVGGGFILQGLCVNDIGTSGEDRDEAGAECSPLYLMLTTSYMKKREPEILKDMNLWYNAKLAD